MLTVRGRYEDGRVVLLEDVTLEGACGVLVTFLDDAVLPVAEENAGGFVARRVLQEELMLTSRECEVLEHLQRGLTNREIAIELGLSTGTVRNYTSSIYSKLKVRNRLEAVNRAMAFGLGPAEPEPGVGRA